MRQRRTALLLSIGYGQGHHAAAAALAEELQVRGWAATVVDPCAAASPVLFGITQRFYHLCVRSAPWLWGIVYKLADVSDWKTLVSTPILKSCTREIERLIFQHQPDVCLCTYPLFAYMLDKLKREGKTAIPYAVVVTDALEISRPWAKSATPLLCVSDTASRNLITERYQLPDSQVVASGFPVRRSFSEHGAKSIPDRDSLNIVYGAFAPITRVVNDVEAIISSYPGCRLTLLAGERASSFRHLQTRHPSRITLREHADNMSELFHAADIYIGKAGASTLFEAYAAALPIIVNYALPGQEQGNLELLLSDGGGYCAMSTADLMDILHTMLRNGAAEWKRCSSAMHAANRSNGAATIIDEIERRFFHATE